ncbi:hypothetical protein Tco_0636138 [Tanacetum coccineum]
MTEKMEQYMSKTRGDYGKGVTSPTINQDTHFELKQQFLKELCDNTFSGPEHEDANEHIEKVLEIADLCHILKITQDQIMLRAFPGAIPSKTAIDAKVAIQEMAEFSQKWHNGTSSRSRSTKTSNRLAAIQAQLNNLRREIKKVNEKMYTAQFGTPYQPGGQYRVAGPRFYQRNNGNSLYPNHRPSLEESLTKFMAESAKRHEENSNIIKEIRASTDASIRNQGASIKTLEIQIRQMSNITPRVLGSLTSSINSLCIFSIVRVCF